MADGNLVSVKFIHPFNAHVLYMDLPRNTRFSALTALLYAQKFLDVQKPGYRYLVCEHLCGGNHALGDYLPEDATELEVRIFAFPEVLI